MTTTTVNLNHPRQAHDTPKPFVEHVGEIRQRLLYSVAAIGITTGFSYFCREQIFAFLLWPLGKQHLYYATPLGAMSFTFEICLIAGVLLWVPPRSA
jgi:Sec-independent protein secretion pathway component TatC